MRSSYFSRSTSLFSEPKSRWNSKGLKPKKSLAANATGLFSITSLLNHIHNFYKIRRQGFVQILIWSLIAPLISFVAVTATAPVAKAVSANPSPVCTGGVCTVTFPYTGDYYTWTVPAGVTSIDFDVQGAQGGSGFQSSSALNRGGYGGRTQGKLSLTPGSTLYLYVGGSGSKLTAGWNGGGSGSTGGGSHYGGGGGGASDIRTSTSISTRTVVAGGGGGGASNYGQADVDRGGNGGGEIGEQGRSGDQAAITGAGSQSSGGAGYTWPGYASGSSGYLGIGGNGGSSTSGGGGGGGYYGGGGGSWNGGGGGSSYTSPSLASSVSHTQGYKTGNGLVVITYNEWTLVYETTNPIRSGNDIVYSSGLGKGPADAAATLVNQGRTFSKIRYRMEINYSGVLRYADVSFDKWTGATISSLAIPDLTDQRTIKENVTNLSVDSNWNAVSGFASGVTNGNSKSGRLEIWPYNYAPNTTGIASPGNGGIYDSDDSSANSSGYGSFQVHNLTDLQTVLAWNNHSNSNPDIGFGNNLSTSNTDWTFVGSSNFDKSTWKLQIFVDGVGVAAPGAPTIGSATATSATTATVAFTAPASNGGSAITTYTATSNPGGITGTVSQAGSGTITVNGLTADTSYTFTVTATNAAGVSSASSASNSTKTATVAPTINSTTVGYKSLTVNASLSSGVRNTWFYQIDVLSGTGCVDPNGAGATSSTSASSGTFTISGITNGCSYTLNLANWNGVTSAYTSTTITACALGLCSSQPGKNAQEIKSTINTNTNDVYWILVNGVATQVYCIMDSAMDGGGWMLAMKGANTGSTFNYSSSYWTTTNTLNTSLTRRNDTNNEDAKFDVFNYTQAEKVMAIFPDATAGGAVTGQSYGFVWNESMPTPSNTTSYTNRPSQGSYVGKSLRELFAGGEKIFIRDAASSTPYSPTKTAANNQIFTTQTDVRFFGFNYMDSYGGNAARFGFGWNENGGGVYPNANEGSNDVSGGIGLNKQNWSAGDANAGYNNAVGVSRQMKFELYVKAVDAVAATLTYAGNSNTSGTVPVDSTSYFVGNAATVLGNTGTLARTGYTFAGWTDNSSGTGTVYASGNSFTLPSASSTLYAKWTANAYTVTYNYNSATGGNSTASASFTTGGSAIVLPTPTRTGYSFAGWFSDVGLTTSIGAAGASYSPTETTTSLNAYAKWTANTYTVTYNYNSATGGNSTASASFTTGGSAIVLPTPTRTGYTFAGWFSDSGLTTSIGAAGASYSPTETTTSLNAYAKWTVNTYSVTINPQGGGAIITGLVGYWDFNDVSALGKNSVDGTSLASTNATYVSSGKSGGGLALNGNQFLSGTVAGLPVGSSQYTIGGWMKTTNGGSQGILGWGSWGTVGATNALRTNGNAGFCNYWWSRDICASFTINQNTWIHVIATFDGTTRRIYVNGASIGSDTPAAPASTDSGFRIGTTNNSEWFYGTLDDIVIYNRGLSSAEITSLYTSAPTVSTWTFGTSITLPAAPTRTGYTFNGWYDAATSGTRLGDAGAVINPSNTSDFTIYAQWTVNTYTVTYNYNSATGGNSTASASFTTGGSAIVLPTPTRTGYTFAGWFSDVGLTTSIGAAGANYSPTASITAYAKWTGVTNTVTYATQGGSVVSSVSWNTGAALTLPAAPTRAGYTFNGWYDAATSGTRIGSASATYTPANTEGFTLYAQWTANSNGVTFDSQGGSSVATQNWSTGTSLNLPAAPTRAGYTFNGWYDAATGGTRVGSGTTSKNGLHFDGSDDQVTVPHASSFNFTNNVTIEAWINTTSTSEQYITTKGESSFYLATNLSGGVGKANFWLNGVSSGSGGWLHSSATVNDGNWHHIVGTYDGSTLKIYVDGVLSASRSVTSTIQTGSSDINIGSRGGGNKFNGKMYDVRFWNVARTSAEIVAAMNSTLTGSENGLVANYTFNQGSAGASNAGLTTATSTTNTNNGTLSGFALTGATSNWIEAVSGISSYSPTNTAAFTIYAQWSANVNVLTFETQGGSAVSSTTFTTGSSITLPAAPTLAGSTFNGWYLATSGGSSIGAAGATYSPVATSTLILYAQWTTTRAISIDSATYLASYALTAATKPTLVATTTAGASSGTITFTSATTSICTVNSTTGLVAFVATGTCSISAAITAAGGFAAATSPSISFAIRAIPGAPTSPTTGVGNQQVVVSWVAPSNTGGGVTSYIVTASPGGATCTWTSGPLTCVVTGLTNGTAYTFSVVSVNSQGNSASVTSGSVTPRTVPGAPTITSVSQSAGGSTTSIVSSGLVLQYDANTAYAGSGTVLTDARGNSNATIVNSPSYVSSGGGYFNMVGSSSQYMITNTSLNSKFLGQTNSATTSIFMWVNPTTSNGVILSEFGSASISAGWHDSQIEMVNGVMRFRVWNGATLSSAITTPLNNWYYVGFVYDQATLTLKGYVNGVLAVTGTGYSRQTPYTNGGTNLHFGIASADSTNMGSGAYGNFHFGSLHVYNSALTAAQIQQNYDAGCFRFSLCASSEIGASVAFTAPASNGGSAITSYTVTASNGATATGTSSPITITGLSLGVPYSFTVTATNAAGASVSSTPSNTETLRGPPGAPSAPTATQLPSGVNVVWSAPSANGAEITDFLIQYSSDSGSTWTTFSDETSTATVATIGGLTNGTTYLFRVAAINAQGTSSYSAASAAFTPSAPPDAPGKPTGSANGTTIEVSWSAPASSNGSAITDYQIFYSQNNGSTWAQLPRSVSTSTAATVSGLAAGNIYLFKAHAVNARGISLSSEVSLPVAIGTVPNAPTTLIAQVDSPTTSVVLTWKKPAGGVGAVAAAPVAAPAADFTPGLLGKRYVNYYNDNFAWFDTAQLFQGTGTPQNSNAIFNFSSNSDFYSWMWTGFFKAPTTGVYRFYTMSDDASHLWIGDAATSGYNASNTVVNNGGLHPPQTRSGMISLVAGVYYPIRIMFGEYGGGDVLSVYWDLPNGTRVTNGTGYFFQSATGTFASAPKGCAGAVGNSAGVQITNENGKCVLRFTNPGANSWKVPAGVSNVDVLVVGAGGGAGFDAAGGGGGGSVIEQLSYSVTANSTIQVQVGNGGATSQVVGGQAEDGQSSLFDSLSAPGGGGGGSKNANGRAVSNASGGGGGHANGGSTSGGSNASSATSFAGWKASSPSMVNIQGTAVQFSYMRGSATNTFTIARNVTTGVRFDVEVDNSINNIIGWRGEKIDTYGMQIELLNTSGAVIARNSIDLTTKHGLILKTITATYTGFVQSVRLTVSGIDTGFWAGWYGPIFRNPSFYIDGSIFGASANTTGFSGGSSPGNAPGHRGGGGGGAAAVGESSTTGNGGAGKISAITGTYFGGGGAGGSYVANGGIGGVGGGGNGGNGSGSTCGNDGVANTGGGGGSMGNAGCGNRSLGRGATGVVILRYNAEVATVELPPPSDYVIQYSVDSPTSWTTFDDGISSSESATVTNLTPGLNYIFRVASRNGVGDSSYSVTSNVVAVRGAPNTAPAITSVVAGNGTASVTFTAPATTGGSPISRYVATATATGTPTIPARTCTWTTGALNCIITELVNGRTYEVKVVAINSFGNSPESSGSNVTPRTVAGAPTALATTAGNTSVRLSWTAPVNNGGVAITGYRIESSTASSEIWSTVVADTSSIATSETITSLVNGTTYKFRVSAINAAGVSVASGEANALPIGAPSTPAAPTAGVGSGQIFLSWSAPANNGSPITDYEIQYSTSSSGPWTTFSESVTSVTATSITGLTNGTSYYFQIRAINAAGNSSWSASSAAAVPATTPSAPSMDTITATTSGTVSIAFTAGANGGANITGYQYSVNDGATWDNLSGTTSPLTVSDLINGVTYQIKIRAVNSQGSGAASGQLSVTPAAAPAAPLISGVVASDTTLAISFSAPANNGGAAVIRYEYQIKASIGAAWSTSTTIVSSPINISNLTNGVGYYIRVRAVNVIGGGDWSTTVTGMPFTSPSAPTISQITPGANQLTFAYTVADNGSAITAAEYSLDSGNTWIRISSSTSPLTIVGLLNGTAYTPMLRLVNSAGAGLTTTASSSTPRTVPSAPQINSVTSGATSLTLALSINNGGAAVSNVAYRYRSVSAAGITSCSASYSTLNWLENWIDWVEVGFTENLTIAGLSNTNCYDVQVRARNIAGSGNSSRDSGRPVSVPTAPTITGLVSGNSSIGVTFTETADNGGTALTRYEYRLGTGTWVSLTTDPEFVFGSSTFYRITGLTNGNNYSISMRAVNAAGDGAASNSLSATPMTTPGIPVISAVAPLDGALRVTFTAPESNGGSAITSYDYSIQSNIWVSITPTTNSFDINGLVNGSAYSISLRANNSQGVGAATTLSGPHTPGTVPASPVIAGTIIGNQSISLIVTPGLDGGYELTHYSYSINGGAWVDLFEQGLANPLILGPATVALTNGTTYRFAVRAHNAIGESAPSVEVSAAPATTASAPVISAITAADNSLQVAFTAPVSNGGSAITSYQFSLNGGTTWSNFANGAGTSSPLTITGLSNGVNYSIKLRAVNTIAAGAASNGMTGIPQIPGAGRASTVQSSVANQSVTITWAPPTAYVGAPISGYRVSANPGGATCLWVSGPYQCTISGLTNGTSYTFTVTSTWDDSGVSRDIDTTVATAAITPRTIASAPTAVTAVGGANQATLSWSAPANNGGAAITDYNFEFSSDDGASWSSYVDGVSSALSGTVAGLRPGTQYRFRVAAVNAAGIGDFSEVTTAAKTFEQAPELTLTLDQQTADGFSFILSFNDPLLFTIATSSNNPNAVIEQIGDYYTVKGLSSGAIATVTVTANRTDYLQALATIFSSALLAANPPSISTATSIDGGFSFTIPNYTENSALGITYSVSTTVGAVIDDGSGAYRVVGLANGEASMATISATRPGYVTSSTTLSGSALALGVPAQISDLTSTRDGFTFVIANFDPAMNYETFTATATARVSRVDGTVTVAGLANLENASVTIKSTRTGYMDASVEVVGIALPQSEVNTLESIALSSGTITFDSETNQYSLDVPNSVSSVTLTPIKTDFDSTISILQSGESPVAINSGSASSAIPLAVGLNTVTLNVTSQVGATRSYQLNLTRGKSSTSTLSALVLSAGTITGFTSSLNEYEASVAYLSDSITVSSTSTQPNATIKVKVNSGDFAAVDTTVASQLLPLNVGTNVVTVEVTAQDGISTSTYVITVTRSGAASSQLGALTTSAGALNSFNSSVLNYEIIVPSGTTEITLTPTLATGTSGTIAVNGVDLTSGATSQSISLAGSSNTTITILVSASDGSSVTPYQVNVKVDAPPAALTISRASVGGKSGAQFTTQPQITVVDASANRVFLNTATVTASISSGATLSGTTTATAVRGLATFNDLGVSGTAGITYQITYSSGGLVVAQESITITAGDVVGLSISAGSTSAASGSVLTTPLQINAVDAQGNTVTTFGGVISIAISTGGALSGVVSKSAASGVAVFTDLVLRGTSGSSYTLTVSAPGLLSATRNISLTFGTATALRVSRSTSGAVSGSVFTTTPQLSVRDGAAADSNIVTTSNAIVTVSISSGVGGTLIGSTTVTAVNGVATFTGLGLSGVAGTTYTLTYSADGLASATEAITVLPGTPAKIALTRSAVGFKNGSAFTSVQPQLQIQDATGNLITNSTATVTATVSSGGVLLGSTTQIANNGIATYTNLGIFGTAGSTYTITFASPGLTSITQTILVASGASLIPAFSSTTPTADGFTAQISNFNRIFNWTLSVVDGPVGTRVALSATGLLTVTGIGSGSAASISATTSRTGFDLGVSVIAGNSLLVISKPTFGAITTLSSGFRSQVNNYDSTNQWDISASNGGTASISSSGLITVIGLEPGAASDVTVTVSRTGWVTASASLSGSAAGADLSTGTQDIAANLLTGKALTALCAGGSPSSEGIANINDRNSKSKFLCYNATSRNNSSYIRESAGFYTGDLGSVILTGVQFTSGDSNSSRDPIIYSLFGCLSENNNCVPIVVNGRTGISAARNVTGSEQSFRNTTPFNYYKITFGALRSSWTDASQMSEVRFIGAAANASGLIPTFSSETQTANGFLRQINNFDPQYTWRATANNGASATISGSGLITVTGLLPGGSATVAVTTTRTRFEMGVGATSGSALLGALLPTFGVASPSDGGFSVDITNYSDEYTWSASIETGTATITGGRLVVTGQSAGSNIAATVSTTRANYADGRAQVISTSLTTGLTPQFGAITSQSTGFTFQISNYAPTFTWAVSTNVGSAVISNTGLVTITGLATGGGATVVVSTSRTGYFTVFSQITGSSGIGAALTPRFALSTSTTDGFTVQILNYDSAYTWSGTSTSGYGISISGTGLVTVTGVPTGVMASINILTQRSGFASAVANVAATAITPDNEVIVGQDIQLIVPVSASNSPTSVEVIIDIPVDAAPTTTIFSGAAVATDAVDSGLRTVRLDGSLGGNAVTTVSTPIVLTIPASAGIGIPVYSPDGLVWLELSLLAQPELPVGQEMGYYRYEDGTVLIFTRKIGN